MEVKDRPDHQTRMKRIVESLDYLQFKLLNICLSEAWGGLEQVVKTDSESLASLGISVEVLVLKGSPIDKKLSENFTHSVNLKISRIDFRPRDLLDFRLGKWLRQKVAEGITAIHCHQPSLLGSIVPFIFFNTKVALFVSRHITSSHYKTGYYHRFIYSRVNHLIAMSHMLKRNLLETHQLEPAQISVIPLGLDFSEFNPNNELLRERAVDLRKTWGFEDHVFLVGLVGRIDPAKGQDVLIQAAATIVPNEERVHFLLIGDETVGQSSEYMNYLKDLIKKYQLEGRVHLLGFQKDVSAVMEALDVCVMPSREETFGLVAIEAMAMEKPVIVSTSGSCDEIIGQDEYGLRVRPNDAFDLKSQLLALIQNASLRHSMGRRARQHVLEEFSREVRFLKTLETYEKYHLQILSSKKSNKPEKN